MEDKSFNYFNLLTKSQIIEFLKKETFKGYPVPSKRDVIFFKKMDAHEKESKEIDQIQSKIERLESGYIKAVKLLQSCIKNKGVGFEAAYKINKGVISQYEGLYNKYRSLLLKSCNRK